MNAPVNANSPPTAHAPSAACHVVTTCATTAGLTKMPAPTMPPITSIVASNRLRRRASAAADGAAVSVGEAIDHVVDADLVGLIGFVHRTQPETRPLPELRDVGVVVDDHLQALRRIVVLEQPAEDRTAADAEDLRHHVEIVDLEE